MIISITSLTFALTVTAVALAPQFKGQEASGDLSYTLTLDSVADVESKDGGNYHQINLKNNRFDMIGWSNAGGAFGNIKQTTFGSAPNQVTYPGLIYNRSIINGFTSLKVIFNGGKLFYKLSEYLMEDMDFDEANELTSGEAVVTSATDSFFVVYTNSSSAVNVDSIELTYKCDRSADATMSFDKSYATKYARSAAKNVVRYTDMVEFDNNPTNYTNNYSKGNHVSTDHDDAWYRWNGVRFDSSEAIGKHFELHTTIIGNISQVIDPTHYFHYAPWPQFQKKDVAPAGNEGWVMSYIGNDNYEPLGYNDPGRIKDDDYAKETYAGRFYTRYDYDELLDEWRFVDPDTNTVLDSDVKLREAYNAYTLPFWHVVFEVNGNNYAMYINGFKIDADTLFTTYSNEDIAINVMHFHAVNYGYAENLADPASAYHAAYTYPRFKVL